MDWIEYYRAMLGVRIHRARTAPTKGASAVEWVIITAIIAVVAFALAAVIRTAVQNKQQEIADTFTNTK